MVTITESASARIKEIVEEENNPNLKLRVFVQGGGCSGFQYGFSLEEEQPNEDDFAISTSNGIPILVDSISMQYLQGATIDFKDDIMGAAFSIDNPNAQTTCGCGSSFSVDNEFYEDHFFDELPPT